MKPLVIATRKSRLALWQAEHVAARLKGAHPGLEVTLLPLSTRGDELIDRRLDKVGGKGLFVKELETAMAEGRADLAVHSMKDMPAELPPGFTLAAITAREDPRDALVSGKFSSLREMPRGSTLGTSSLRRSAQVGERYPGIEAKLLRGNVETRIAKLERGEYDAILLAAAGLKRLGLENRIASLIDPKDMLPAPGQGALGIECVDGRAEVAALLGRLADPVTADCVRAERTVSRALGGSCTLPLAAFAEIHAGEIRLRALVASSDGRRVVRAECAGPRADPEALGERAAEDLRRQGAEEILGL
jgi:hydroxymethylbilane synthase